MMDKILNSAFTAIGIAAGILLAQYISPPPPVKCEVTVRHVLRPGAIGDAGH